MDKENKLIDFDRLDCKSKFTMAVPQKIMASDLNPSGMHLYIEQRAYIAKELELQGYGDTKQAVREFTEMFRKHIGYDIEREANHSKIKAYNKSLDLINKLLTEVIGE